MIHFIKWLKQQPQISIPVDMNIICSTETLNNDYKFFNKIGGTSKMFDFDISQDLMWNFDPNETNQEIQFKVISSDGFEEYVSLGINSIRESMAALYQEIVDEESVNYHPAFPYKIVTFIVNNLFPAISRDKKKLICICHIALNSSEPVKTLLNWLVFANQNPDINGMELYEKHMEENCYLPNEDGLSMIEIKVKDLLQQSADNFSDSLNKILQDKENNYVKVLTNAMKFSDIHLRVLYYHEDLVSGIELIKNVCGVPFIFNDSGDSIHLTRKTECQDGEYYMDDDITFLVSLDTLCLSFLLPKNSSINRCVFRTIHCNKLYNPEELSEHVFCIDQPWRERGCRYWKILSTLELDSKPISYC